MSIRKKQIATATTLFALVFVLGTEGWADCSGKAEGSYWTIPVTTKPKGLVSSNKSIKNGTESYDVYNANGSAYIVNAAGDASQIKICSNGAEKDVQDQYLKKDTNLNVVTVSTSDPKAAAAKTPDAKPSTTIDSSKNKYEKHDLVAASSDAASDPCAFSATLQNGSDGNLKGMKCKGTKTMITVAQATDKAGQIAASQMTTITGNQAQQQLQNNTNQATAYDVAGKTQVKTGKAQEGMGGINMILGVVEMLQGYKHKKNADEAKKQLVETELANDEKKGSLSASGDVEGSNAYFKGKNDFTKAAVNSNGFNLNNDEVTGSVKEQAILAKYDRDTLEQKCKNGDGAIESFSDPDLAKACLAYDERTNEIKSKKADVKRQVSHVRGKVVAEQNDYATQAVQAGVTSLMTGGQLLQNGLGNVAAGKGLQQLAKLQTTYQAQTYPVMVTASGTPNTGAAPGQSLGGSGDTGVQNAFQAQAAQNSSAATVPVPDLGPPGAGTADITPPTSSPAAPWTKTGDTPPIAGGGGNGTSATGGGLTPDPKANGNAEEQQAQMLDRSKSPSTVGMSGGGFVPKPGGGGGADKGPDISGILAQFLPKKDEEDGPKNSILDFNGGKDTGRGLASGGDEVPFSVLDKNANIFERIHQTYQEKNEKGFVGL